VTSAMAASPGFDVAPGGARGLAVGLGHDQLERTFGSLTARKVAALGVSGWRCTHLGSYAVSIYSTSVC